MDARKRALVAGEPRKQQMILPQPVDAKVLARVALARKARLFEQPDRGGVRRDAGGLETMQAQRAEREGDQRAYRAAHQAAARERLADPVTEAPGLRDAAPDIGKRQPAGQRVV